MKYLIKFEPFVNWIGKTTQFTIEFQRILELVTSLMKMNINPSKPKMRSMIMILNQNPISMSINILLAGYLNEVCPYLENLITDLKETINT